MKILKVILIGAGSRGYNYVNLMKDNGFEVVGVADPSRERVNEVKDLYDIPEDMCFESWEGLLELPKFADIAVIATSDTLHYAPAMKALEQGYHLLLEKPVAPTAKECADIANLAKEKGVKVLVCHVLRYAPFFKKLKELIKEGLIGEVTSIHHAECVGVKNFVHSFVRGIWQNSEDSSDMLLAKSCHDIDLIQWLMDCDCKNVHSFGSLTYFKRENAPEDSPEYCIEGCPHESECPFSALKFYSKEEPLLRRHAFRGRYNTEEEIEEALRTTEFGKCAFKCNNNVVDTQVVNLEFDNGKTASFNMTGLNSGGRHIRVMGRKGDLVGSAGSETITHYDYLTKKITKIPVSNNSAGDTILTGHGGGDLGIVKTLYQYITEGYDGDMLSEIGVSVSNHMIVFAAEESRREKKVVDVDEYKKQFLK